MNWVFFLSKKLIKSVSIPHAATWFLGFSSCVCSLFLLLLLYFPSSFHYTKHWYAFSLSECCFALKKATKPERATHLHQRAGLWHVAPTPTQKGQLLLQVRECKSMESRWEPWNVLVPWLETTYCCGCPAANPFLWLGLPLGGVPRQWHIHSPSLVEVARALPGKGWGLRLPGVIKAMQGENLATKYLSCQWARQRLETGAGTQAGSLTQSYKSLVVISMEEGSSHQRCVGLCYNWSRLCSSGLSLVDEGEGKEHVASGGTNPRHTGCLASR